MRETSSVIPHFTGINDMATEFIGDFVMQFAVGKRMRAIEHGIRQGPVLRPVSAGLLMVAVNTAGGDHYGGCTETDSLSRGIVHTDGAGDFVAALFQGGNTVTV